MGDCSDLNLATVSTSPTITVGVQARATWTRDSVLSDITDSFPILILQANALSQGRALDTISVPSPTGIRGDVSFTVRDPGQFQFMIVPVPSFSCPGDVFTAVLDFVPSSTSVFTSTQSSSTSSSSLRSSSMNTQASSLPTALSTSSPGLSSASETTSFDAQTTEFKSAHDLDTSISLSSMMSSVTQLSTTTPSHDTHKVSASILAGAITSAVLVVVLMTVIIVLVSRHRSRLQAAKLPGDDSELRPEPVLPNRLHRRPHPTIQPISPYTLKHVEFLDAQDRPDNGNNTDEMPGRGSEATETHETASNNTEQGPTRRLISLRPRQLTPPGGMMRYFTNFGSNRLRASDVRNEVGCGSGEGHGRRERFVIDPPPYFQGLNSSTLQEGG